MQAAILDHLPDGLLDLPATALAERLGGPTLIHLPGRRPNPLFVSVLQHGNEISGWDAVRRLLKGRYRFDPLPRSLALFIGNVDAAAQNKRRLPDQPDYNRCWPGAGGTHSHVHDMMQSITDHMRLLKPFASIDIHNNTGENPHYAAVNSIEALRLNLATRFSRTVIFFTEPGGVQSMAFGRFCPAVTLECGQPYDASGTDHAMTYLESVLSINELSSEMPHPEDLDLFQVTTVVRVPPALSFSFDGDEADVRMEPQLDRLNFSEMPPGTKLANVESNHPHALLATDSDGFDCTADWFRVEGGQLFTRKPAMPAMFSTDIEVVRQDCLCYLMERIRIHQPESTEHQHPELPESLP